MIVAIESFDTATINGSLRITQSIIDDYTAVCRQLGCAFNVAGNEGLPPAGDVQAFQKT
ncbi:MAG: hypothetical protein R3A46_07725 [Thermomicrobiales bacterium]